MGKLKLGNYSKQNKLTTAIDNSLDYIGGIVEI